MKAKTCCGLSQKSVIALVTKWQRRLDLDDWKVYVACVNAGDGIGLNESGTCEIDNHRRRATILINIDRHQMPEQKPDEIVDTVIHELLHLWFWWLDSDKYLQNELLERAFHPICKALRG